MLKLLNRPTCQVQHRTESIFLKVLQHKKFCTQPRALCWGMPYLTGMRLEPFPPLPPTSKMLCCHPLASISHPSIPEDSSLLEDTEWHWKLGRSLKGKMAVWMYYGRIEINGIQSRAKYQIERTRTWKRRCVCVHMSVCVYVLGTLRNACSLDSFSCGVNPTF